MSTEQTISEIDFGPIYKETIYGRWPVEPFNTLTTLLFLVLVLYWRKKIKNQWRLHRFIRLSLAMIAVGFVGGFLYHGFRNSVIWLLLDWVPILITAILCTVFCWQALLKNWYKAIALAMTPVILFLALSIPFSLGTKLFTLFYPLLAASILLPISLLLRKYQWKGLKQIVWAVLSVVGAILLRTLDRHSLLDFLPMGSHFLWHIFGCMACHFLIKFFYENSAVFQAPEF